MTRGVFAAMICTIALAAPSHEAHAQRRIVPFAGAGLAKGMGDLSDDTGNGWLVFGGFNVPVGSSPALTIGLTGSYAHVPYNGDFSEATTISALLAEVGYTFLAASPGKIKPYIRAGGGATIRKYDPGSTGFREESQGKIAFSGGAGLQYLLSSVAVFAGAHIVTDADAGYLAIHGGVAFPGSRAR
jgi:hypothetical protein